MGRGPGTCSHQHAKAPFVDHSSLNTTAASLHFHPSHLSILSLRLKSLISLDLSSSFTPTALISFSFSFSPPLLSTSPPSLDLRRGVSTIPFCYGRPSFIDRPNITFSTIQSDSGGPGLLNWFSPPFRSLPFATHIFDDSLPFTHREYYLPANNHPRRYLETSIPPSIPLDPAYQLCDLSHNLSYFDLRFRW